MPSAIDATVGGPAANSYATMAEAITYFGDRLHKDAWANASATDRAAALLWSARVIDARVKWKGSRTEETQALSWPRAYVLDPDPAYLPQINQGLSGPMTGYLASDAIPQDIKDAQCEMALALLGGDITAEPSATGLNSLAVGSLRLDFAGNTQQPATFPRQVDEILLKYGTVRSRTSGVRKMVRS